jgi:hypothetical protein
MTCNGEVHSKVRNQKIYVNWIWGMNAMECEVEYDQENNCTRIPTFHKFEQKFFCDQD